MKHECFSKDKLQDGKYKAKQRIVDMKSFSWSTLFLSSQREDWRYSSASITGGSSLHLHLKSVLKCWLTVGDAAVSQYQTFQALQKYRCPSTKVLFAGYADVRYVLHLRVRQYILCRCLYRLWFVGFWVWFVAWKSDQKQSTVCIPTYQPAHMF